MVESTEKREGCGKRVISAAFSFLFLQPSHFSIYVPLRREIQTGSDGVHSYELEPTDVESEVAVFLPTLHHRHWLITAPSVTRTLGLSLFLGCPRTGTQRVVSKRYYFGISRMMLRDPHQAPIPSP